MVSVEMTEMKPSSSTIELELMLILPPGGGGYQEMEGEGTPLVVQVKVTMPPALPATTVSAGGSMILTGSAEIRDWIKTENN